jgi:hypothetical protein
MVEKRRSWRIEHDGQVKLLLDGESWSARFVNLSEGGCLLVLDDVTVIDKVNLDMPVCLEFNFPNDHEENYEVSAKVSHFRTEDASAYIGFSFVDAKDACVTRIKEFIEMFTAFA